MSNQLAVIKLPSSTVTLHRAAVEDLPQLVALLADDPLGRGREVADGEGLGPYRAAFDAVNADDAHLLIAAKEEANIVGMLQLTFLPGLARRGALRAQIEAVRVHRDYRGSGLGTKLFEWSIEEARKGGCALVQLTTDNSRTGAHRFYRQLGFDDSHQGFKLQL